MLWVVDASDTAAAWCDASELALGLVSLEKEIQQTD